MDIIFETGTDLCLDFFVEIYSMCFLNMDKLYAEEFEKKHTLLVLDGDSINIRNSSDFSVMVYNN